jgi:hypothetical protein
VAVSVGTLMAFLDGDASGLRNELKAVRKDAKALSNDLEEMGFQGVGVAAGAFATALGAAGIAAVKLAADLTETTSAMGVAFGSDTAVANVEAWVKDTAAAMGRGEKMLRENVTNMQLMLGPLMGSAKDAEPVSKALTKLAVDVGSLLNVSDADALHAFRSAMAGEAEPVKRFGVTMTEAAMDAWLLSKGVKGSMASLSEQAKASARAAFLMDKLRHAQGDAAATGDSLANQTKTLEGAVVDLATRFGQVLLPAANAVVTALNGMVGWVRGLSDTTLRVVTGVLAFAGVLAAATAGAVAWVAVAPAVTGGLALIGGAFTWASAMALPLIIVLLKIIAVVALVALAIGILRQGWENDSLYMRTAVTWVWEKLQQFAKWLPGAMSAAFDWVVEGIESMRSTFWNFVAGALAGVGQIIGALQKVGLFSDFNVQAYLEEVGKFQEQKSADRITPKGTRDSLSKGWEAVSAGIAKGWDATANKVAGIADTVVGGTKDVGSFIGHSIKDGFSSVAEGLQALLGFAMPGAEGTGGAGGQREAAQADADALVAQLLEKVAGGKSGKAKEKEEKEAAKAAKKLAEAFAKADKEAAKAVDAVFKANPLITAEQSQAIEDSMAQTRPFAVRAKEAFENAGKVIAGTLMHGAGLLSDVLTAAVEGFTKGGWIGALVGAGLALLMASEGFQGFVNILNSILQSISNMLGRLFDALNPLLGAVSMVVDGALSALAPIFNVLGSVLEPLVAPLAMVGSILNALSPLFTMLAAYLGYLMLPVKMLEPALRIAFEALKLVARGIGWVFLQISYVWNALLGGIASLMRGLGNLEIFGWKPFGFLLDWASDLEANMVDTEAVANGLETLKNTTWDTANAQANAAAETRRMGDAARDAASSLTNVPNWWKVEGARYDATAAGAPPMPALGGDVGTVRQPQLGGAGATVIEGDTTVHITVEGAGDPAEVADLVMERMERLRARRTGSRYADP